MLKRFMYIDAAKIIQKLVIEKTYKGLVYVSMYITENFRQLVYGQCYFKVVYNPFLIDLWIYMSFLRRISSCFEPNKRKKCLKGSIHFRSFHFVTIIQNGNKNLGALFSVIKIKKTWFWVKITNLKSVMCNFE